MGALYGFVWLGSPKVKGRLDLWICMRVFGLLKKVLVHLTERSLVKKIFVKTLFHQTSFGLAESYLLDVLKYLISLFLHILIVLWYILFHFCRTDI